MPCATNLQSNPAATVEWRDNNGAVVADTARYDLNNAAGSVSLDITPTQGGDNGQWSCTLNVMGPPGTIGGENVGNLTVTIDIVVVGKYIHDCIYMYTVLSAHCVEILYMYIYT